METKLNFNELKKFLKKIKPDFKSKNSLTDHYQRFMRVHDDGKPRDLYLYPIDNVQIKRIDELFVGVIKSLYRLSEYIVFEKNEWLKKLGLEGINIEAVKSRGREYLFNYSRIDSIFDGEDYRVLEVNSKRPQIYEEVDWMNEFMEEVSGGRIVGGNIRNEIVKSIKWSTDNYLREEPELVLVVSDFVKYLERENIVSGLTEEIKGTYKKSKVEILGCRGVDQMLESIEAKDGFIIKNGIKVGLIVIKDVCQGEAQLVGRFGEINNELINKAYQNKKIEISTPPVSAIIGSKLSLSMIMNEDVQRIVGLDDKFCSSIGTIMKNFVINRRRVINKINKKNFVIKISNMGGGKGVYMGPEMTGTEFRETIKQLLYERRKVILQEKVRYKSDSIIDLQNYHSYPAYITLDPFIINNPGSKEPIFVGGYASRAIKKMLANSEPRFNPDANRKEIMFGGVIKTACIE